jgi:hypothetical protein
MRHPIGLRLVTLFYAIVALLLFISGAGLILRDAEFGTSVFVYFTLYVPMVILGFPLGYAGMALAMWTPWAGSVAQFLLGVAAFVNAKGLWNRRGWARVATAVHALANILPLGFGMILASATVNDASGFLILAAPVVFYGLILAYVIRWQVHPTQ